MGGEKGSEKSESRKRRNKVEKDAEIRNLATEKRRWWKFIQ